MSESAAFGRADSELLCALSNIDWLIGVLEVQDQERWNGALRQALAAKHHVGEAIRSAGPTITGSSHRADDPGQVWVRMSEADYEALRA